MIDCATETPVNIEEWTFCNAETITGSLIPTIITVIELVVGISIFFAAFYILVKVIKAQAKL